MLLEFQQVMKAELLKLLFSSYGNEHTENGSLIPAIFLLFWLKQSSAYPHSQACTPPFCHFVLSLFFRALNPNSLRVCVCLYIYVRTYLLLLHQQNGKHRPFQPCTLSHPQPQGQSLAPRGCPIKKHRMRGTWVAQSVECPTSAQVMISQFVGSSPASGCGLTAQSLEPPSDSVSPFLSLPFPHSHSVFLSFFKKKKKH